MGADVWMMGRSYKGKPENQWRLFEVTKIKSIPTIIRWTNEGEKGRYVSESIDDSTPAALAALLA